MCIRDRVGVLPQASSRALGGELLAIAATLWVVVSLILVRAHKDASGRPGHEFAIRVGTAEAAEVPAIVAGSFLLAGSLDGMWWQAAATMLCIVAGVADAWILLVEDVYKRQP